MYNVFQIKISKEVSDYVNSNGRGHTGGEEKYPIYEAKMRLQHGRDIENKFNDTDFAHFTKVCSVKKEAGLVAGTRSADPFVIDDLEEVFAVLNGRYYDEDSEEDVVFDNHVSDYKWKTVTRKNGEKVTYRDMHSLSVGDIVEDVDNGSFHIVASYGFKDITEQVKNFVEFNSEVA
tara:strand:- start:58 stop:585 length:528 start_codon:yes stop_codon:yes gene_type:complete